MFPHAPFFQDSDLELQGTLAVWVAFVALTATLLWGG
jgi:hypothetical protein